MNDHVEQRRYPRVVRAFFTAIKKYEENGELEAADVGRTLNISEGGILLEVSKAIPLLSNVKINLAFDNDILKVDGEVVHLRKNDENKIEMGIKFLDIGEEGMDMIRKVVL